MASGERARELRRRRHRKVKMNQLKRRVEKGSASEKTELAHKVRRLTPGGSDILVRWGVDQG